MTRSTPVTAVNRFNPRWMMNSDATRLCPGSTQVHPCHPPPILRGCQNIYTHSLSQLLLSLPWSRGVRQSEFQHRETPPGTGRGFLGATSVPSIPRAAEEGEVKRRGC